jgi:hypothetical protein
MNSNVKGSEQKTTGQANGSQMRITENDIAMIKKLFKGNDEALKLLRKMFLPELDPSAPFGQMIDLWMTVDIKDMTPEEAYVNLKARNTLITHLDQQLFALATIANKEEESVEQVTARLKANSAK